MKLYYAVLSMIGMISIPTLANVAAPQQQAVSYKVSIDELKKIPNLIPIAIIGSGPAGLSAGLFTAREHYHTVIFQGPKPLGMLSDTAVVENWPGIMRQKGNGIMKTLETQVKNFGVQLIPTSIERIEVNTWPYTLFTSDGTQVRALTIIMATGSSPRQLNIPGEKTYWGKGVAVCTQCDGQLTQDQDVVVVGGGETAVSHAIHLLPNAKHISLVFMDNTLKADRRLLQKIKQHPEKITLIPHSQPIEIKGNDKTITSVTIKDINNGTTKEVPTQWVFLGIGNDANSQICKGILKRDARGIIETAPYTQETSMPGIYAAGKVANSRYKLGAMASGDGIKAGLDAVSFLEKNGYDLEVIESLKGNFFAPTSSPIAPAAQNSQSSQQLNSSITAIKHKKDLTALLNNEKRPILLEFYSPTCPHCQAMQPIVHEIAKELPSVAIAQSANNSLSQEFNVKALPTFIMVVDKKEKARRSGETSKEELMKFIKANQ